MAVAIRVLLTPFSWLYSAGWRLYMGVYRVGLKRAAEPHRPVICIGGLTAGGSGKSPVALHVAEVLEELGHDVVISCSGYASPAAEAAQIAPEGPLDPKKWGDEAAMFRYLRPQIPLIVGRRRVLAAELCHRSFPKAVLLMDDGFQHLPLKKHVEILLLDEGKNRRCLPAGPYREPYSFRNRADLMLPGQFRVVAQTLDFKDRGEARVVDSKRPARALCALGQPGRFFRSLEDAGVTLLDRRALPDHDSLMAGNLFEGWPADEPIIVTAKDWVKLRERGDLGSRILWVADYRITIEPQEAFRAWIESKLNESRQEV